MNKYREMLVRRRRPLLWAGGLLSLYALLGFLLVPWLAERQLVNTLQQRLGASAAVEQLRFNPFTFTASIDALTVQTADSTPLLSLGRLYVNLEPSRFLLLKLRLADIVVDTLQLHYTRYTPTDATLTRLAQQWAATAEPEPAEEDPPSEELFPLEIGRLQVLNSSVHYRDEVPQTDFETSLGPLDIDVANVSTRATEEPGSKNFVLQIEQDATLTWTSSFDISPLRFSGHLALDNFSFATPWRYFQDSLLFELTDGRLTSGFDYLFNLDASGPQLEISNLALQVSALNAVERATNAVFLTGGTLALENGSFLYPDLNAQAAALRIDGVNLALQRNPQGVLNLQAMLNSFGTEESPPPDAEAGTPLQLSLTEFTLVNTTVNFTDHTTPTPAAFSVQAQAALRNFTLVPDTALPFDATLALASGGTLTTMGTVQLFPALDVDATLELADLALLPTQPYLDEFAQVVVDDGTLALSASLRSNTDDALALQGDLTLSDLQLTDRQRGETLFSLDALRVTNADLALDGQRLDISDVSVDALYARVLIDENGITNVGEAFTPATASDAPEASSPQTTPAAATEEPPPAAETGSAVSPFALSLGRLVVNGASSDFTDRSLPIVFDTQMTTLDGELSGFSSTSSEPMTIALEGQVNEYGLVEISGALNPLDITRQTYVELQFTNLEMPAMTPYVIKFAGREIAEGTLNVALTYTIEDSALQATNAVTIEDMRLGARVDYPDAMDLPLDLAVALLKNSEGIIDLNVPVSGNVNDPQFDLGPVIRQAIFNAIGSIVTSPFRLLGSLIGGDAEELDSIRFRPGRSDLAPPEQQKLQQLLEALAQRPQLALVIPAPFAVEEDTRALQTSSVDARIDAQLAQDESAAQLPERRLAVLEGLYTIAALSPVPEELRLQFMQAPAPDAEEDDAETAEPVFDSLAYSADLRERLIAAEPVAEQQLQDLARARQGAITAFMLANGNGAVTAARLQEQEVETAAIEDGWLMGMLDVGVSE